MNFKDTIKSYINKIYRKDRFTNMILHSVGKELELLEQEIKDFENQLFFDTATNEGLKIYERDLGLKANKQTIDSRRQNVQANWTATRGKVFRLKDIQNICNAWRNGKVSVSFKNGVILLEFNDLYGRPSDLDSVLATIEEIKPAHLPLNYVVLFHTWSDTKTKTWSNFNDNNWNYVKEGEW